MTTVNVLYSWKLLVHFNHSYRYVVVGWICSLANNKGNSGSGLHAEEGGTREVPSTHPWASPDQSTSQVMSSLGSQCLTVHQPHHRQSELLNRLFLKHPIIHSINPIQAANVLIRELSSTKHILILRLASDKSSSRVTRHLSGGLMVALYMCESF